MRFAERAILASLVLLSGCNRVADRRPWVHAIRFEGAKKVAPSELKKKLATEETSWVPWAKKRRLSRAALDMDVHGAIEYARSIHSVINSSSEMVPAGHK